MTKQKCLVVGLGNIGMKYDLDLEFEEFVLTHCAAISGHDDFILSGGVDINKKNRDIFVDTYSSPAFDNIGSAIKEVRPSVGVICCPTNDHYAALISLVESQDIKAILCEKPLSYDIVEAQEMVNICAKYDVPLYVNYMRRADPNVVEIKRRITSGEIAGPIKVSAWYSKGLLNNGSHLVDLASYWLGDYISHKLLNCERHWNKTDPEPDVYIQFEKGSLVLMSAWEEFYTHFTVELLSRSGRLYYSNGGEKISFNQAGEDDLFKGYKVLADKPEIFKNHFLKYQYHVYDQLSEALQKRKSNLCDGFNGLSTLEILGNICGDL